ncbi:MAG: CBS domain-containing protein [Candidatus Hydrothermae bacterium]|nr:CBS domain-containing protein [Candidatus Hydrothermae bacterium]
MKKIKKVREIMWTDVIVCKKETSLKELLEKFKGFHTFPLVPVVDDENKLVGVVRIENLIDAFLPYDRELIRYTPFIDEFWDEDIFEAKIAPEMGILVLVEDIMDYRFDAIDADEDIKKAYKLMRMNNRCHLPVVEKGGELVGIVGIFDIIREVFRMQGVID